MMMLRVMTYNIHKGIGGIDRRYRLQRIIDTIAHYQPDIVFLQEVDEGVPRSRFDRQAEQLGQALGFEHHAYQANVKLSQGHYGNAILSRFALIETWDIDLTIRLKKRRQAIVAKVQLHHQGHSRTLLLTNVHLGLAGFERVIQLGRLLASEPLQHIRPDTPALIGGDFNDVWGSLGKKIMNVQGFTNASGRSRTFPAYRPLRSLDAIYFRGGMHLQSAFVGHIALAKRASDHLPLIADFVVEVVPSKSLPSD